MLGSGFIREKSHESTVSTIDTETALHVEVQNEEVGSNYLRAFIHHSCAKILQHGPIEPSSPQIAGYHDPIEMHDIVVHASIR